MALTGIILAGGKSSRMGQDKGLMLLDGKPMIQYVIDAIQPLVDEIIIISNQEEYAAFGYIVYEDIIKEQGPLAGICTGLKFSKTQKNLVVSCDVPYVNEELLSLLIKNSEGVDVVIPEKEGKTHQLIGVYDRSCLDLFHEELTKGNRKIKLAIEQMNCKIVDANYINKKVFNNINSKDDITA
ncbi:MAG: molybdenum cofactor guanylyltransferase [Vicingus serpentipes]|nr:molybdenum cofactor guanylyltransferase [Vicingus serpentipes]